MCFLSTVMLLSGNAAAGTVSPVQSTATPFGLQPIALVQIADSDQRSSDFYNNDLPILNTVVNANLSETVVLSNVSSVVLNVNDLFLSEESDLRVYFIGEGAGYHNTLGFYTGDSTDGLTGDAALIFPDASTSSSYLGDGTAIINRTADTPLAQGDFVELGTFEAGTQINLFLIANGANGGTNTYFTDPSLNADGIDHFIALSVQAIPDSPYLLVGVEDLFGGGDEDYNDVVFALDIGALSVAQLVAAAVPLPSSVWASIGFLAALAWRRRQRRLVSG